MPALNVGELTALINADDDGMRRGLSDADLRMRGFQRDVEGRLRHLDGRFATLGEQIAAGLREGTDEGRRFSLSLRGLAGMAGRLGGLAASIGGIAAKLGAAVPLAAGLAAAVGQIAPAAGLAATGMFAVVLASNALKLGMVGVSDAVSAAMDPSKAEEFNEALKKLSPSAQAFAKQVKALQPEFKKLQQGVQERLFKGLDTVLKDMGKHTLPVLRNGLFNAAHAMNLMAQNVGNTAVGLSKSGALGQAISGANTGLYNLSRIPAQIVQGLTQVAAAAAPSFGKLTAAAGRAFDKFAEKMQKAFDSGAMQDAIERAIALIGELAEVAGNVFRIIGSVFGAAEVSGGGFLGVLKDITGQLADAFASPEVQGGLKAIFGVMAQIGKSVGPVLVSLLKTLGQVFEVLGPPVEELVKHLGDGLLKIADALGPVLVELAKVVGEIVEAALPFVDLAADLVAAILPALVPLFQSFGEVVKAAAPFLAQLAKTAGEVLLPILNALAREVLPKILPPFTEMATRIFPLLTDVLVDLTPSLTELGLALADLLVEAAPLIVMVLELATAFLGKLLPAIGPLIGIMTRLTSGALSVLADFINRYVIPAVKTLGALLSGDFSGALSHVKTIGRNVATDLAGSFGRLRDRGSEAFRKLRESIAQRVAEAVTTIRGLPGKAQAALGDLGSRLYASGRALVRGFINGLRSMVPDVGAAASGLVARARAFFPFSPAKEGPFSGRGWTLYSGQSLAAGFAEGINARAGLVQSAIGNLMGGAQLPLGGLGMGLAGAGMPGMALGPQTAAYAGSAQPQRVIVEFRGPDAMRDLIRDVVRIDGRGDAQTTFGR
ncbi:hypothetical protein AB0D99_31900 [Streptomyces sp. NPDC047971]|uniref:phage tail protein n=1 Tax=Streptomyces sp. NPDC047971 TaxID=3154499 RepID=UPI0033E4AB3C